MQLDLTQQRAQHRDAPPGAVPVPDHDPHAQLVELSTRMERVREEERATLSRELHDDIGGTLAALKLVVSRVRKHAGNAALRPDLDEMLSLVDNANGATQRIIRALRPGILDQGLVAAIDWEAKQFQRRTGIACNFRSNRAQIDVPKGQGVTLYRVCQEALTNAAKHAKASVIDIQLHRDGEGISLEIADNGCGFEPAVALAGDSFGLVGMRERAKSYGGWIEIDSAPGRGTTVMLSIPLRRAQDARP